MKRGFLFSGLAFLWILTQSIPLFAQKVTIRGEVTDEKTQEPIAYASVYIKDIHLGVTTDSKGKFELQTSIVEPPFKIVVSGTDYEEETIHISRSDVYVSVELKNKLKIIRNILVEAPTRQPVRIIESPVTIEYMDNRQVRAAPDHDPYNSIANLKGVQFNTNSLTNNSLNTRGFANFINVRFLQLIDGVSNAVPGLQFTFGNLLGVSELDLESVELAPGPSSSLYGPNAFNGILFLKTKDPFRYQGASAMLKGGLTLQEGSGSQPFYEMGVRLATTFGEDDQFAAKLNFSAFRGTDWQANDSTDMDASGLNTGFTGNRSPSYDGVNLYGDEIATTIDVDRVFEQIFNFQIGLVPIHVARTGYAEEAFANKQANSYKLDAGLYYKLNPSMIASLQYKYAQGSGIYHGDNRIQLDNLNLQQVKAELKSPDFFVRANYITENAGDTYDMRFAAWNLNRAWKTDEQWFRDYTEAYLTSILGFGTEEAESEGDAHAFARSVADKGRLEPGTEEFDQALDNLLQEPGLENGARFIDRSSLFMVEGNYNLKAYFKPVEIQIGGEFRNYQLNSQGTLFNDADGPIPVSEYGLYVQASKALLPNKLLKVIGSLRYDKNQNFSPRISPRAAAVLTLGKERTHNFRVSYQTGFRNPDPSSQYLSLNLGFVNSVGGVEDNIDRYAVDLSYTDALNVTQTEEVTGQEIYENSYTAASVDLFEQSMAASIEDGLTQEEAARLHSELLEVANVEFVKPEKISTFEIGYKSYLNHKLLVDFHFNRSQYEDFIFFTSLVNALTGDVQDQTEFSGVNAILNGQTANFQVVTNSAARLTTVGAGAGFNYAFKHTFTLGLNYSFLTFSVENDLPADQYPGLNAPKHQVGFQFGSYGIGNSNLGFMFHLRWMDEYLWRDRFGTGLVDQNMVMNLQLSYTLQKARTTIKVGGTNLINPGFQQALGTPRQGRIVYLSLIYNQPFNLDRNNKDTHFYRF